MIQKVKQWIRKPQFVMKTTISYTNNVAHHLIIRLSDKQEFYYGIEVICERGPGIVSGFFENQIDISVRSYSNSTEFICPINNVFIKTNENKKN